MLYLRDFSPVFLTRVICGWRVNANEDSAFRNDLKQVIPKARLISSTLNGGGGILGPPLH
jgi:hypothetical protein